MTVSNSRRYGAARRRSTPHGPLEDGRLAYRPSELAGLVGLSTKAVYRAIERGELGAAKVANGSRLLIPAEAAEAWLATTTDHPRAAERASQAMLPQSDHRPLTDALVRLQVALSDGSEFPRAGGEDTDGGLVGREDP